jgi:hypothetical protein
LSSLSRLKLYHLLYFSKPSSDRPVYQFIRRQKACRIVEMGIGAASRAVRMIELAAEFHSPAEIHYTGVDLFEARSPCHGPGLSLKAAHRLLKATGARIKLVPATPAAGLAQVANTLGKVDLVLLSSRTGMDDMGNAWFYLPRLLHDDSQVFLEIFSADGIPTLREVAAAEITALSAAPRRRAA